MKTLETLIKIEEHNIMKDTFEYLPIRGLLLYVLQFNTLEIKREWLIEKNSQSIHIDSVDVEIYEDEANITFYVEDVAFKSEIVDQYYYVNVSPDSIKYKIYSRYSIGSNVLEYNYIDRIDLTFDCIQWELSQHFPSTRVILKKHYDTYMEWKNILGNLDCNNGSFDVCHTENNSILNTCIILVMDTLEQTNEHYSITEK